MRESKPLCKVPIGTRWAPRVHREITDEEIFTQALLLAKPRTDRHPWLMASAIVLCVVLALGLIL